MTLQKGIAQVGFAKQTAKGTPATAPTYTLGLTGGTLGGAEIEEADLDTTWSTRGTMGRERLSVVPTADLDLLASPASIGLLLKLALGAETVTGSGPYTHVITPGATIPYCTIFGTVGGGNKTAMSDSKIDSLELSWDKTGSVRVKVSAKGCEFDMATSWTVGSTGETVASGNTIRPGGGTFSVNSSSVLVTGGSIKIENNVEPVISSASGRPGEVMEKDLKVTISLNTMPDDIGLFRLALTGAVNGTATATDPVFVPATIGLKGPGSVTLDFDVTQAAISAKMPEVDASGGPGEIPVELIAIGSPAITATLVNGVTAAY